MWNNFGGRRPGDAVWRELVSAAAEGRVGGCAGAVQIDISKMFDRVQHRKLALAAGWLDFPVWLLRSTLAAYRWPRTLVLQEGIAGAEVRPVVGVIPGSAMAVYEVAALLAALLIGFYDRWAAGSGTGLTKILLSM
jgi:hypothetical protein